MTNWSASVTPRKRIARNLFWEHFPLCRFDVEPFPKGQPCTKLFKGLSRATYKTYAPARLDRLPWGRFHTLVIAALEITWILDGLEVTLAGSVAGRSKRALSCNSPIPASALPRVSTSLALSLGRSLFGWMANRLGRRLLFFITLTLYLVAAAATAFSWDLRSFCLFRFLTGAGIGGEYAR